MSSWRGDEGCGRCATGTVVVGGGGGSGGGGVAWSSLSAAVQLFKVLLSVGGPLLQVVCHEIVVCPTSSSQLVMSSPMWMFQGVLSESGMQTVGRCILGGAALFHDMLLLLGSSIQSSRSMSASGVVARDVAWVESVSMMMHTVGRCRAAAVIDRVRRR